MSLFEKVKKFGQRVLPPEHKSTFSKIVRVLYRLYVQSKVKVMSGAEVEADRAKYIALNTDTRFNMNQKFDCICVGDKYCENGNVGQGLDHSYFVQDIWGARKVISARPAMHYDVGSSLAGFVAHLMAAKQNLTLIDIRPISGLDTKFLNGGGATLTK